MQRVNIIPSNAVKYLCVWLKTKLTFKMHVDETVQNSEKTSNAMDEVLCQILEDLEQQNAELSVV